MLRRGEHAVPRAEPIDEQGRDLGGEWIGSQEDPKVARIRGIGQRRRAGASLDSVAVEADGAARPAGDRDSDGVILTGDWRRASCTVSLTPVAPLASELLHSPIPPRPKL